MTPILEDVWKDTVIVDWNETELRIVSREGLSKMKRLAGRHQDLADLENLELGSDDDSEE